MEEEEKDFAQKEKEKLKNCERIQSKKEIFEVNDDIAKKLLDSKYYLSALEFHTELLEHGRELPRLKDFFSNPANFEIQMKLESLYTPRKTGSCLTLDSIDDLTRYSDDGHHDTDERVTILEFELRKAKETIHELRENITKIASETKAKQYVTIGNKDAQDGYDIPANRYEARSLNFLVNKYLLKGDYKLTSITFAEEVGDQDLDDWEDVGLNTGEPPSILQLLRDFSKHDSENRNVKEIERLRAEIKQLTLKCEKMKKEIILSDTERNDLPAIAKIDATHMHGIDGGINNASVDRNISSADDLLCTDKKNIEDISSNSGDVMNTVSFDSLQPFSNIISCEDLSVHSEDILHESHSHTIIENMKDSFHHTGQHKSDNDNYEFDKEDNNKLIYELQITNTLLPEQFLRTLYSLTCKKGISRLSEQMCTEEDISPVEVITLALPNIIPSILLSKREEVIPLILCAVQYHSNVGTRDELLSMLFNLIKRPDSEQRRIIIDGCLSFAHKVESSRIESELLPQCWEQIGHKYAERRLLVTETCGSLSPFISTQLLSSLVFSMLVQMLEEEANEEVRISVIKNLSVIMTYMIESEKYIQAYTILERSLNDMIPDVIIEAKNYLLPVIGLWSLKTNKLQSHLLPRLFSKCLDALQCWYEGNVAMSKSGETTYVQSPYESKFINYLDCLSNLCSLMFCHCLLNAPFSYKFKPNTEDSSSEKFSFEASRIPTMNNSLCNLELIIEDPKMLEFLIYEFDEYFRAGTGNWESIEWICSECILKICEMCGLVFANFTVIDTIVSYMVTICKTFGKPYTLAKIVPLFEACMRDTGVAYLHDIPPICSPLLVVFLCGILANFDGEEQVKKLITFIKQCLLTISTQKLSLEYLIYAITILCRNETQQYALMQMLRETLVYPVSDVRRATSEILGVLVKTVRKDVLVMQVAPAIITLSTDNDMNVVIAAVPALGSVMESVTDKNVLDKAILQLQTLLEDEECKNHMLLQKVIIKTFTKILPNLETRLRDEFFLSKLKTIAECNHSIADVNDRLEIAEELISAFSATLCCFLSKDTILNAVIPSLKYLESELKEISPETMDIVVLLLKDAENKMDDDNNSTGSVSSTASTSTSKLFSGFSSRFDKFKKKKDQDIL